MRQNAFEKTFQGEMLIEQILNLVVHIFLKLVIFMPKQKSSKANLRVHYLMIKMLQKAMYLDFIDFGQVTKLTPKCKILNVLWTWPEVKRVIFSIDFQTSKILIF